MTDLKKVLADHEAWIRNEPGGIRANLRWAELSLTNLYRANLSGADLRGANLRWALLSRANLKGADLRGADLIRANLSGADLCQADLRWADLRGAKGYIVGPTRSDGYRFDLRMVDGKWRVVAGCNTEKNWGTDEYRRHAATYRGRNKATETLAILDYLDARAALIPVEAKSEDAVCHSRPRLFRLPGFGS